MPLLGLGLVVLAVALLLWLLHRSDAEDQRTSLITDALWVEQDLHFHLGKLQDLLRELGSDSASGRVERSALEQRMRFLMATHPWVAQVAIHDAAGGVHIALPPGDAAGLAGREAYARARTAGRCLARPGAAATANT